MFDIKEQLKMLPDKPGVYLHKDKYGNIIYVGKAVSLKNRVRSYFRSPSGHTPKVRAMVSNIVEFEYITTDSEMEALILECNLIKRYQPKYNVLLRDDKTYPYLMITLKEEWPRIIKTRIVRNDGNRYFGPYSDVKSLNETIDLLNSMFELKQCSAKSFPASHTPCLNYHIEKCYGVCCGGVSHDTYMKIIDEVMLFLQGKDRRVIDRLKVKMMAASDEMNYERAAELRDLIAAAEAVIEKQKIVMSASRDMDLVLVARGTAAVNVVVFNVRAGKLSGRDSYLVDASREDTMTEIISSFMKQFYGAGGIIPKEIAVEAMPEDWELLERMLSRIRGSNVRIILPKKGELNDLMNMAKRDVIEMVKTMDDRVRNQQEKMSALTAELNRVFGKAAGLDGAAEDIAGKSITEEAGKSHGDGYIHSRQGRSPAENGWRIEAYDISNTAGTDSVGGMVVFQHGKPVRSDYRKFKIKTIEGPDDYGSLQEVVYRRFKRGKAGDSDCSAVGETGSAGNGVQNEKGRDTSGNTGGRAAGFSRDLWPLPDLMLIDGGEKQVNAVQEVADAMGVNVMIAGMVKDDRHRTRGLVFRGVEINLKERPILYSYIGNIQEEVHRFSIEYHKGLRGRHVAESELDRIPGIGQRRRSALLASFGSIRAIRDAGLDALAAVPGMNAASAAAVHRYFHPDKQNG